MLLSFAFVFGLLGNVVSFLVYISPSPTFYRIYKVKSTQGFEALPYSVALFSSMLTCYYGIIKKENGTLLITINSVGIVIESIYLIIFFIYAPKQAKLKTLGLVMSFNVGALGIIILLTSLLSHGQTEEHVIGWICAVCSVCFFASPLCVIRTVIKTKSAEFMPFWLSLTLTISAVMWFAYGFFIHDAFVAVPNVLGLAFGVTQMILYFIYRAPTNKNTGEQAAAVRSATATANGEEEEEYDVENGHVIKLSELVMIEVKTAAEGEGEKKNDKERQVNFVEKPQTESNASAYQIN